MAWLRVNHVAGLYQDTKVRELSEKTHPAGFGVEPTLAAVTGTSAVGFPLLSDIDNLYE